MEANTSTRINLPVCINHENCSCFLNIFQKPIHYNPSDVLQYTTFNLDEITKYLELLHSHIQLDEIIHTSRFSFISACEVHKANEHFLETVKRFQIQLLLHSDKGEFYCNYYNEDMNVNRLNLFYEELGNINTKSIQLFNKPCSPITIRNLIDVLDLHKNCLYIFQQFFNVVNYGRPIFKKDNYYINIHNFYFKK